MQVIKRILTVMLILSLGLALGFFGRPADLMAAEKKVTITLWHIYGPEMGGSSKWFKQILSDFAKEYPNIIVEEEITPNDPYKVKFKTAMQAGQAADACLVYPGAFTEPFARDGALLQVDKYLNQGGWRNDFKPATFAPLTFGGKTYGFPVAIRTVHMFYNKDVFKKYNLKPVKTMAELKAMIKTLKSHGVTPIALGNKERWMGDFWVNYLFLRYGGYKTWHEAMFERGKGFADPSFTKALAELQELVKMGAFTEGVNGVGAMDVNNSFFTGDSAMILSGTFFINIVMALAPKGFLDETLGYFNFPSVEGGRGNMREYQGGVSPGFIINAKTKHPDEVATFYRFMFRPENMKKLATLAKWVTIVKGSTPENAGPLLKGAISEVNNMENLASYINYSLLPNVWQVYADYQQAVFALDISPEEAASKIRQAAAK
jgi:raffinose/stachyose/melibiose transport system substrate-binding protein